MAHVLIVVARRFNGHELWTTLGVLQNAGHTFEVRSTSNHIEDEVTGKKISIKNVIGDPFEASNYEGILIISGNMADTEYYWKHETVLHYIAAVHNQGSPVGAICCSVPTIRKVARGRRVSFFPLVRSRELLEREGAILSTTSLSVDGKLVTAENQMVSQMWAEAFAEILHGRDPRVNLKDSGFTPGGWERKPMAELENIRAVVRKTSKKGFKE